MKHRSSISPGYAIALILILIGIAGGIERNDVPLYADPVSENAQEISAQFFPNDEPSVLLRCQVVQGSQASRPDAHGHHPPSAALGLISLRTADLRPATTAVPEAKSPDMASTERVLQCSVINL